MTANAFEDLKRYKLMLAPGEELTRRAHLVTCMNPEHSVRLKTFSSEILKAQRF